MTLPNKLSIFRVVLIPFFIISCCYYYHDPGSLTLKILSTGIFVTAVITDILDGYTAKRTGQKSRLGSFLDPLADKLLLTAAFTCLFFVSKKLRVELPVWLLVIVVSRDFILTLGSAIVFIQTGQIEIRPSLWGKLTTVFQMVTIITLLLEWEYSWLIWPVMVVMTIASGIDYIIKGSVCFNESSNRRPA